MGGRVLGWLCVAGVLASVGVARAQQEQDRPDDEPDDEGFFLELATGGGSYDHEDAYGDRLFDFGFESTDDGFDFDLEVSLGYRMHPNIAVGARYFDLDASSYFREGEITQTFNYDSYAFDAFIQGDYGIGRERLWNLFVRGGIGVAAVATEFDAIDVLPEGADNGLLGTRTSVIEESQTGATFSIGAGFQLNPLRYFGVTLHVRYTHAPALVNELGDTHDLGVLATLFGLRLRTWGWP